MNNWLKIYKQSLKNSFSSSAFWVVNGAFLLVMCFFILIMPSVIYRIGDNKGPNDFQGSEGAGSMITMTSTILMPFFTCVVGELNANASERIFILSRPIRRDIYLSAKIMSSFTLTLMSMGLIILMIFSIWWIAKPRWINMPDSNLSGWKNYRSRIFGAVSPGLLSLNIFELTFCGTIFGTCFRYYVREMMTSIVVMLIAMIYTITFSILTWGIQGDRSLTKELSDMFNLQFKILPPLIYVGGGIIGLIIGIIYNNRMNVGK